MWVSCGAPKTRFADGGGSLGKGRHELRGAQRRLPVLCIAEMGAALGCCGHPAHSDLMGALLAQGIIPPDAPGHERRFVSTFIPPGRKGSVRAGCSPAYRGGWAGMLPASLVPDSSRWRQSSRFFPARDLWQHHSCSPPAGCPVPPGWDMWPGPGTAPGAEWTGGAGVEANKQIFLGVRKLSEMLVFGVSLSFFCSRLPVEGFALLFIPICDLGQQIGCDGVRWGQEQRGPRSTAQAAIGGDPHLPPSLLANTTSPSKLAPEAKTWFYCLRGFGKKKLISHNSGIAIREEASL